MRKEKFYDYFSKCLLVVKMIEIHNICFTYLHIWKHFSHCGRFMLQISQVWCGSAEKLRKAIYILYKDRVVISSMLGENLYNFVKLTINCD